MQGKATDDTDTLYTYWVRPLMPVQSLYRSAEGRYTALSESLEGATAEGEKLAQV